MDHDDLLARARAERRARLLFLASLVIGALVAGASLLGLFAPWPYQAETENWVLQARGQDIGNLLAVVVLVGSSARMRGGSPLGKQVWLGTMFYLLYAYIVYAFAVHFGRLFLAYVAVLGLVTYTLIGGFADRMETVTGKPRRASHRFAAWVLIGTGSLFAVLWLGEVVPATISGEVPGSLDVAGLIVNPVHVIDLAVVLPGMIVVGVLALRREQTQRSLVLPALVFSVLMGLSIIAAMLLILASGDQGALMPMAMVSVVVGTSLAAAIVEGR